MTIADASMPAVVIVMGVSGSGKTSIASLLAELLQWQFADADSFHSQASLRKLRDGIHLTDEDRWPWLQAMASWIDDVRESSEHAVLACSALKRSYRDILIGERKDVRLVYLEGTAELIGRRLELRRSHFMPAALLQGQFDTLEAPQADEDPVVVGVDAEPGAIAAQVIARLALHAPPSRACGRSGPA